MMGLLRIMILNAIDGLDLLEFVSTEKMMISHFIAGLRDEIQGSVVAHAPPDYASALQISILMDMHRLRGKQLVSWKGI